MKYVIEIDNLNKHQQVISEITEIDPYKIAEEVSDKCIAKVSFSESFITAFGKIHNLQRVERQFATTGSI